jgi:tetratricopeptide (TPR) repeat protein
MMLNNDINLARTYNNLGFCQANIKEYDQAIQNFNVALKISPSLSDARNNIKAVKQMRN